MMFNRRRFFKPMTPERTANIADLMIKLVGETVNDKIIRAVLVGAITAGSQYLQMDSDEPVMPVAAAPAVAAPQVPVIENASSPPAK